MMRTPRHSPSAGAGAGSNGGGGGGGGDVSELEPHLCLSLVMTASLPPPPSEMEDSVETEWTFRGSVKEDTKLSGGGGMNRKTLDVCLDDEETLGLWVAALRGLATEIRTKPTAYPSPLPTTPAPSTP